MFTPETSELIKDYKRIDKAFNAKVWLCGKTTMEEFTNCLQPDLDIDITEYPQTDFIAKRNAPQYVAVIDPNGELGYKNSYLEKNDNKSYIIEILTEVTSKTYIAYLRKIGISYIFAGKKELDLNLAMKKLKSLFGFELLISHGGGYTNGKLLKAGLIDKLSIVHVPLIEDNDKEISLFGNEDISQSSFELKSIEKLENNGEWLRIFNKKIIYGKVVNLL